MNGLLFQKRKSRNHAHNNFDTISEDLNCKKKNDSIDMFGLNMKEPKERSGSSETAQKQLQ